jgi:hypothetical protein
LHKPQGIYFQAPHLRPNTRKDKDMDGMQQYFHSIYARKHLVFGIFNQMDIFFTREWNFEGKNDGNYK